MNCREGGQLRQMRACGNHPWLVELQPEAAQEEIPAFEAWLIWELGEAIKPGTCTVALIAHAS